MRRLHCLLAVAALLASACAPRGSTDGATLAPSVQALPPGTRGKVGAAQAVEVSPVPAFRAVGNGWRLEAEGVDGMRLSAHLQLDGRDEQNATLVYDRARATAAPRTHVLAGTLYGVDGDRAIEVTLVRERCMHGDGEQAWRAELRIAGGAALAGCADVAT